MAIRYSADEVLEMALQIERNGARFYEQAAERAPDEHSRKLLLELAAMEKEHERTFASMREDLSEQERKEMVFDPDGELPLYLRAWADRNVFSVSADVAAQLRGARSMPEILQAAIGAEKDSVVFYTGLKRLVPARFGAGRLDQIIEEEMGHMATLGDLLRCLSA